MRIVCPSCDTAYTIPDAKIGAEGREVRCARCATKWFARLPTAPAPEPEPEAVFLDDFDAGIVEEQVDDIAFSADDWNTADPEKRLDQNALDDLFAKTDDDDTAASIPEPVAIAEMADDHGDDIRFDEAPPLKAAGAAASKDADVFEIDMPDEVTPRLPDRPPVDIESLARSRTRRARRRGYGLLMQAKKHAWQLRSVLFRGRVAIGLVVLLIALVVPVTGIVMRRTVVKNFPQLASLYKEIGFGVNLRGLDFDEIRTYRELENGQPVLVVEGAIANITLATLNVPSVRLALRGAGGQEIYAWSVDPKAATVPAGDMVRFRARLASPPEDAVDVQLRFLERKMRQASHP